MTVYYNENEPFAAEVLRQLIIAGHIADGVVDTRSIEDVCPSDLAEFTQCHFFAGFGVWSYALRRAGWPDDRPVWTGSCPCQPFSAAGQGAGFADERHLWPAFHHLIKERRPAKVFGEQVASSAVDVWIDLVHADLEALGYAFGSVPFPSAGVGAPHIRDRNYWVAHASGKRWERGQGTARGCVTNRTDAGWDESNDGTAGLGETSLRMADAHCSISGQGRSDVRGRLDGGNAQSRTGLGGSGMPNRMGHAGGAGLDERERERGILGRAPGAVKGQAAVGAGFHVSGLADTDGGVAWHGSVQRVGEHGLASADGGAVLQGSGRPQLKPASGAAGPGPTNGLWRDADWLFCRDGKWRPVEPSTFPLAHGAAARVGRLRGYGNAINAEAAIAWIEVNMEKI